MGDGVCSFFVQKHVLKTCRIVRIRNFFNREYFASLISNFFLKTYLSTTIHSKMKTQPLIEP